MCVLVSRSCILLLLLIVIPNIFPRKRSRAGPTADRPIARYIVCLHSSHRPPTAPARRRTDIRSTLPSVPPPIGRETVLFPSRSVHRALRVCLLSSLRLEIVYLEKGGRVELYYRIRYYSKQYTIYMHIRAGTGILQAEPHDACRLILGV